MKLGVQVERFLDKGVNSDMLDLSWKVFTNTGNLDTYLLIKELERDSEASIESENTTDITLDSSSQ